MSFFINAFNPHYWPPADSLFWCVVLFWLGCMVGSFLNVCIYRMPLDLSVVSPPSHCPHCKYSIPFYLNIPLLTWLSLRGRCKNCGAPISPRYFIVELMTGLTFLACWLHVGTQSPALALVYCLFLSGLIVATFIDFEHYIIPDEITLGGVAAGFVISFFLPSLHHVQSNGQGIIQSALGIVAGWGIVYGVVRGGKLLFGKYALDLDPDSRLLFTESTIVLPPKHLKQEQLSRRSGWFAFQASKVELVDRCLIDVKMAVSERQIIIESLSKTESLDRDSMTHVEVIFERQLSSREAASIVGARWSAVGGLLDWFYSLFESFIKRHKSKIRPGDYLILSQTDAWLGREELRFEDIFYRPTDCISLAAREVRMQSGSWQDVSMRLKPAELKVGDMSMNPEAVSWMEVVTDRMVLPREAMGFGDVKFMAAIGAFLGWQAVVFTLIVASMVGAGYGAVMVALRKQDWSGKLYFGPFLALAATIWIFCGPALVLGYVYYSQHILEKLIGR